MTPSMDPGNLLRLLPTSEQLDVSGPSDVPSRLTTDPDIKGVHLDLVPGL